QPAGAGHLADHRRRHLPAGADGQEALDVAGRGDGHHPFLRLAHEDLGRAERPVPQRHGVEPYPHPRATARRQLRRRAGDAGRAQVLDAGHQPGRAQLQAALDKQLLHERVPDLDAGPLRGLAAAERGARQHRGAADAVRAGPGAEQDDLVALAARDGELEVLVPHDPHAQRVDQRVPRVAGIEAELAADVGQAEAVAVEGDAADDAGQHAGGAGRAGGAEPERVITATGRAPMARMSRTIPPTPVAAPWNGSTYDGWLCDSILKVTAYPWPMSTTPALCPMPASRAPPSSPSPFTGGALSANWPRYRPDA